MERIKRLLEESGVENYFLTKEGRKSTELFFVKKKLDLRRINSAETITITVFVDAEADGRKLRGRNDVAVDSSMTDEEIKEKIATAKLAAGFALNPFYNFPDAEVSDEVVMESDLNKYELKDIADKFIKAVYEEDNDSEAFINSFEIFIYEKHVAMKSSYGTDVSYVKRNVEGEFVAQCKEPQDVETYQNFDYDSLALSEIKKLVKDTLILTKNRAKATAMPKTGEYDVIISDKYMPTIINFFGERAHAAYVFQKYSNYEVGKNLQESCVGDVLNMKFGVTVPFNDEGIKMIERPFIENGIVKTLHGNARLSEYLGIPKIGTYEKGIVEPGKIPFDEMKKNCLHVVNFSDFQLDAFDGHFKGEIRLAYLYDENGNVTCLTGGSVNGSIIDSINDLCFSREVEKLSEYEGPVAVKFKNVAVSGE